MKRKLPLVSLLAIATSCSLLSCSGGDTKQYDDLVAPPTYTEDSFQIHYYRADRKFSSRALWLWDYPSGEGKEYAFNGVDEYGAIAAYPLSEFSETILDDGLGFIVKSAGSWSLKDPDGDRVVHFSKFDKDENGIYNIFLKSGDEKIYSNADRVEADSIISAQFTSATTIEVETNNVIDRYKIYRDEEMLLDQQLTTPTTGFRYTLTSAMSFDDVYSVEVRFKDSEKVLTSGVSMTGLYKTEEFEEAYNYGGELGVSVSGGITDFKVRSPIAQAIKLRVYDSGTPTSLSVLGSDEHRDYEMIKGEKGVWETSINEDLSGKYYTYLVTNSTNKDKEIVDPYAKSAGVNGLRGQIVDFTKTNPEGWGEVSNTTANDRKATVVYETHLADITSSKSWGGDAEKAKLFAGAYESGTTYVENGTSYTTGFDHIKELGVNAVQFIPIFDQANDEVNKSFNWGYNPLNYNCLEGSYSSDPYDGYTRIREFKELVKAYRQAGISIIMDVVYNHVNNAVGSNFDVLMPGYYYRYDSKGNLSNGSGCGNETASEMPMFRKFMIDSTEFWASEYKLGGFRFDLMGLHDLSTMNALVANLKTIDPNIVVYGEPRTAGTSTLSDVDSAKQVNGINYEGYGQFNDQMRDALIKGGLNSATSLGWVDNMSSKTSDGDISKIEGGIKGITMTTSNPITDPNKTTNYVTCHDNYTLYDRFMATNQFRDNDSKLKAMNLLANSIVLTSQGTSFMLSGEEFLRSKGGDSNSYESSYSVNELDYSRKADYPDLFENYKKLIALKKSEGALHLNDPANKQKISFFKSDDNNMIGYKIRTDEKEYAIVATNGYSSATLPTVDLDGYDLYLDTLSETKELIKATRLSSFETLIAYKNI
jgi:pullulanase